MEGKSEPCDQIECYSQTYQADIHTVNWHGEHADKLTVNVYLNVTPVQMEVDTAAGVSIINEGDQTKMQRLSPTRPYIQIRDYSQKIISTAVEGQSRSATRIAFTIYPVVVVTGKQPNLFGRNRMFRYVKLCKTIQ